VSERIRLGLSAGDDSKLVGCSDQSIYKWENGKSRPRASQIKALAKIKGIGKKDAAAQLGR
jgi:predicted transcriptional regulator